MKELNVVEELEEEEDLFVQEHVNIILLYLFFLFTKIYVILKISINFRK